MVTFNELLVAGGIDPAQTAILRHSGTARLGITPFDLWSRRDGSFDQYQSTQAPGKPLFHRSIWASFVSTPARETMFVGMYAATLGRRSDINWSCPMTGLPPGADKGRDSDFYHLTPLQALSEFQGSLKIEWGGGYVAWARYAEHKDHRIMGEVEIASIATFAGSPEGRSRWGVQKGVERSSAMADATLVANAAQHGGSYVCEACGFSHQHRAMFDVHHTHPLLAGPRLTRAEDLLVLCPLCHRRAHQSDSQMLPFNLAELQAWNDAGRP